MSYQWLHYVTYNMQILLGPALQQSLKCHDVVSEINKRPVGIDAQLELKLLCVLYFTSFDIVIYMGQGDCSHICKQINVPMDCF